MTTPPPPSPLSGPGETSPSAPRRDPPKTQGQKLAEALGFGGAAEGATIMPPIVPPREPKKAFPQAPAATTSAPTSTPAAAPIRIPIPVTRAVPVKPPAGIASATVAAPMTPPTPVPTVRIAGGNFLYGETKKVENVPAFEIDRDPVTNVEYERFVRASGHRHPLYWRDGVCPADLLDHPVVGVDYFDAMAYARWAGKDLPYEDEWERAARGTDGRTYPWGDDPDTAANTARAGLKMTLPVAFHPRNVSPDGCRDMVGNTWELTHSPAPGGGVVVRGGSWYDFALYAKTFFRFASRADSKNGTIGFRCVKRAAVRTGMPRAVLEAELERGMAARRGKGEPVDAAAWSPERRDLVPDLRRLKQLVALRDEELAAVPSPQKPPVRKAFAAAEAAAPMARAAPPPVAARPSLPPVPVIVPLPPTSPIAALSPPTSAPVAAKPAAAAEAAAANVQTQPALVVVPVPPRPPVAPIPAPTPAPVAAKPSAPSAPVVVPAPSKPPVAPTPAPTPAPVAARPPVAPAPPKPLVVPTPVAPAPIAAKAPATLPIPERRPQTGPLAPGAVTAAGEVAAREETLRERERAEKEAVGAGVGEHPSPLRLALVVMGFLAASVLVVVAILHASSSGGAGSGASPEETARRYGIPAAMSSLGDAAALVVVEADSAGGVPAELRTGSVLLVFATPGGAGGTDSIATAVDLHRRLRGRDVRVVVVVPRASAIDAVGAVRVGGVSGDVSVLPDAGALKTKRLGVPDEPTAVLLEAGVEALRVSSPDTESPLLLSHLAPLVQDALIRHPVAPTPPAPMEGD